MIPKKERGSPPQSKRGEVPKSGDVTVLKPVQRLTPLKLTPPTQASDSEEEGEDEDE